MSGKEELGRPKEITIAHISDVHTGSQYFISSLFSRTIEELNELQPTAVVITGDLTDEGFRQEYKTFSTFLKMLECPNTLLVPGNHDARNVGYLHFEEMLGARGRVLKLPGVSLIGLDSSEPDLDSGRIGRERYLWLEDNVDPEDFTMVCLHHHLIPVPGTGRERNIVYDAGDVLEVLVRAGVDMVLSGHKHVPYVWRLENLVVVNAGTCASMRLRGRTKPCYNILKIGPTHVQIHRKFPFGGQTLIADFSLSERRFCRWEVTPSEAGAGGGPLSPQPAEVKLTARKPAARQPARRR